MPVLYRGVADLVAIRTSMVQLVAELSQKQRDAVIDFLLVGGGADRFATFERQRSISSSRFWPMKSESVMTVAIRRS